MGGGGGFNRKKTPRAPEVAEGVLRSLPFGEIRVASVNLLGSCLGAIGPEWLKADPGPCQGKRKGA